MPTATPVPTQIPLPALGLTYQSGGLLFDDPYVCGAGFFGTIAGGVAPYTATYSVSGPTDAFSLGSFTIAADGAYESPPGFINYSVIPDAVYDVTIMISDSAVPPNTLNLDNLFRATITDMCGPAPTPVPTAAFVPAGPVSTGHLVVASPAPPVAKAAQGEPKKLALTGTDTSAVQWALLSIAGGALLLGAPLRRRSRG